MANTNVFLGSGTSVTFVPEVDIYLKPASLTTTTKVTLATDFTNNFSLVDNLYVGCLLEFYDADGADTTHRVTANDSTTISFHPAITATLDTVNDYFRLKGYGAPCPAPNTVAGAGTTYTDEVTDLKFLTDTKASYSGIYINFNILPSDGGTEANHFIWFDTTGSESAPAGTGTAHEVDISDAGTVSAEEYAALTNGVIDAITNISSTRSGTTVTMTNSFGGTTTDATSSATSVVSATITTQGSAVAGVGTKALNSDNWLGIVESLTFPQNEVEFKQQNVFVGGSRNFTHQYKGIETAGSGSIGVVANHGAWLYYFLGKCSSISATLIGANNPSSDFVGASNKYYLDNTTFNDTGPLFYRSVGTVMTPPVLRGQDAFGDLDELTEPTVSAGTISNEITYTFTEQEGEDLPSFGLEQVFSKLPASNTYRTNTANANEDTNFVLVARGNRVNDLSLTANENEEVKMTLNLNARNIHTLTKTESYDARRGVTDESTFKNFASEGTFLEPFFFSSGTINMFGQNFLRITNFTLNMNNNLADKRYVGVGSKSVKDAIPAQRTYEMTFTAQVTDDQLYNELINSTETSGSLIDLIFDKANGEQIRLKFDNYFLTNNSWPIPEDKGAVMVEGTIQARTLSSCTVKTHWILQG